MNFHFKSDLILNQTSILYGLFIFGNKRVKEHKTCMCLLFFLDVDISGTILWRVVNYFSNVYKVSWSQALPVYTLSFFYKKKKQNEFQAEQTNSRKESILEGYAKLKNNISSATQAVYAIGRSVKLLYHPLSVFLTAQML